jgi:hypothetical protein
MPIDRVSLDPVFLSASVPHPLRDQKYFETADTGAIRDAVIALLQVVLPRTKLVFGGHPAITPLLKWVADQHNLRMFQSKFFRDRYLEDLELFRYEETEEVAGDRERSVLAMRLQMIQSETFSAAFFIGGMEGVEIEYELVQQYQPAVPRFPVYTTGGAARLIWSNAWRQLSEMPPAAREVRGPELQQLRTKTGYVGLFTSLLEGVSERRGG